MLYTLNISFIFRITDSHVHSSLGLAPIPYRHSQIDKRNPRNYNDLEKKNTYNFKQVITIVKLDGFGKN